MENENCVIYYREEIPEQENTDQEILLLKEFAAEKGFSVESLFIEKCEELEGEQFFDQVLQNKIKSTVLIVFSFHHLTRSNFPDFLNMAEILISYGFEVISVSESEKIDKDKYEELASAFSVINNISNNLRKEKINLGLYNKRKKSPTGKVHTGKGGHNYRKTDKDEVVTKMRRDGFTLNQIAEKEGISVGRVRNIIKAVKEGEK